MFTVFKPVMESRTQASRPRTQPSMPRPMPRTRPSRPRLRTRLSRPRPSQDSTRKAKTKDLKLSSRILEDEYLSSRTPTLV